MALLTTPTITQFIVLENLANRPKNVEKLPTATQGF
jgi:hypothetical protein